jgi:Na+-transporting NADH:ubiquinone oxidoreductase subunit C
MQKGEGNDYSNDPHKVDGMSGATLTAKGVNNMFADYFTCYKNYLKKSSQNVSQNL